jgi:trimethylamine:corrinoid methyltransferase-like protein
MPHLMNREQYAGWEAGGKTTYEQRLTDRVRQLLIEHQPEQLDMSIRAEMQRIVDQAG